MALLSMMSMMLVVGSVSGFTALGGAGAGAGAGVVAKGRPFVTPRSMPVAMAKGFGSDKAANKPAPKPKSQGQLQRDEAGEAYERNQQAGYPEYSVYARPFGGDKSEWK